MENICVAYHKLKYVDKMINCVLGCWMLKEKFLTSGNYTEKKNNTK